MLHPRGTHPFETSATIVIGSEPAARPRPAATHNELRFPRKNRGSGGEPVGAGCLTLHDGGNARR